MRVFISLNNCVEAKARMIKELPSIICYHYCSEIHIFSGILVRYPFVTPAFLPFI